MSSADSSSETLGGLTATAAQRDREKREAVQRRNAAIRAARRDGARPADLTRESALHAQMVYRIISAASPEPEAGDVAALAEAARTATARYEDALTRRNDAIRAAVDDGMKVVEVMEATGLSHQTIHVVRKDATTH